MFYKLKMSEDEVIAMIAENVSYARGLLPDVQFSCEDATRSDRAFLLKAVNTAIKAGATTINIPDTVGYAHPEEIKDLFSYIISNAENADRVVFATHCHNDLGLAVANTLAAVQGGASQAEVTVNGIGERAGNAALEEVAVALDVRKDYYDTETTIVKKQIFPSSQLLSSITGVKIHPTKPLVGKNAFMHESGIHQHGVLANPSTYEIICPSDIGIIQNEIVLGKHSGKHAFKDYLDSMDVRVSPEDLTILFEKFKEIADKKKTVTYKDISYLLTHTNTTQVKKTYTLVNYGITTIGGNAMANITLQTENGIKAGTSTGDGPLDAAFKTINTIIALDIRLEDWSVNAITEGKDALGAATLRLEYDGREATGRGISTDTVEASILAYINGCNKLFDTIGG
jgi:2-isopropylmalate synthase